MRRGAVNCSSLRRFGRALAAAGCLAALTSSSRAEEVLEFFEREIRPVLLEQCVKCHGAEKQASGLRLDTGEGVARGGENGPVIVAGDPRRSRLVAAIRHEGDLAMPPNGKLTDRQIAAITRWVELGAPWPKTEAIRSTAAGTPHWAFQPIVRRPPPEVHDAAWPRTPIDAFLLARLEQAGLTPSPPADRRTLIRRVTLDVTGLPPSAEEVEQFLRDADPLAYERLVERLLASPHYGEQWARHWLDVARYSDTKGYVYAREERFWVHAWSYRDWVVQALNDDLPYDRFLLLQIAADQAAAEDATAQAALGFLTLGRRFLGVKHDIIDDRIDVVTRGALGLTVGCARCHDHKYDPISTRDYYALYGVFQNCTERLVPLSTWDHASEAVRKGMEEREAKLRETLRARRAESSASVRSRIAEYLQAQLELHKYPEEGFDQILEPNDLLPAFVRRFRDDLARRAEQHDPIFAAWRAFLTIAGDEFSQKAASVSAAVVADATLNSRVRERFREPPASLAEVANRYGQLFTEIDQEWQAAVEAARTRGEPLPEALADPAAEALRGVLYGPDAPCEVPDEPIVTTDLFFPTRDCEELWKLQGEVDRWLIRHADAPAYAVTLADRPHPVNARVLRRGNPALLGDEVPRQFLQVLSGANQRPFRQGSGRYELAQAIVDPRNPLTARVMVNRVWQHHFGVGLVRTPSDFGLRAEPPSHPELLDWLAASFIDEGWSLKWLHRQILLSAAYQQQSSTQTPWPLVSEEPGQPLPPGETPDQLSPPALHRGEQLDPDNRWLWRMNPRRLAWEELRDALFSASGELQDQIGGRPFDLFAAQAVPRRTLYGLVDRQFLPSALRVFDFANPDLHTPQRNETIVPQQALFLLNHPLVIGRAEVLAAQVADRFDEPASEASGTDHRLSEGVDWLFWRVLQRPPSAEERRAALALVADARHEQQATTPSVTAWQYGYGRYHEETQRTEGFTALPYFTGTAWQGGPNWPDASLGWVQLTAAGGHAGNDRDHAAIRRWVAPRAGRLHVRSTLIHDKEPGDGIRGFLVSSRHGLLHAATLHNSQADFHATISVEPGDTLDFVVDIGGTLNSDDFVWEATLSMEAAAGAASGPAAAMWNSRAEFSGRPSRQLSPWGQLAHVLLLANEFFYVD